MRKAINVRCVPRMTSRPLLLFTPAVAQSGAHHAERRLNEKLGMRRRDGRTLRQSVPKLAANRNQVLTGRSGQQIDLAGGEPVGSTDHPELALLHRRVED